MNKRPKKKIVKLSLLNPGDVFVFNNDTRPYVFIRNVYLKPLGDRVERRGFTNRWDSFMNLGGHTLCVKLDDEGALELKSMDLLVEPNVNEAEQLSTSELANLCSDIHSEVNECGYPSKDYYEEEKTPDVDDIPF